VCGREAEIVKELAQRGSPNYQLLEQLMNKGATIMGTESSELLVQEYELMKQALALAAGDIRAAARVERSQKARSGDLLQKRDHYIASRINDTLLQGETGILFLGMLHSLKNRLDQDISVIYPFRPPPHH
jgi:Na+/phosphate symporter